MLELGRRVVLQRAWKGRGREKNREDFVRWFCYRFSLADGIDKRRVIQGTRFTERKLRGRGAIILFLLQRSLFKRNPAGPRHSYFRAIFLLFFFLFSILANAWLYTDRLLPITNNGIDSASNVYIPPSYFFFTNFRFSGNRYEYRPLALFHFPPLFSPFPLFVIVFIGF